MFLPVSEMCMGLKHIITFPTQLITQVFLSEHQVNMAYFLSMAPKYFPVSSVGSFLWFVSGFTSLLLNVFIYFHCDMYLNCNFRNVFLS